MIDQDAITSRVVRNLPQGVLLSNLSTDEMTAAIEAAFAELLAEALSNHSPVST